MVALKMYPVGEEERDHFLDEAKVLMNLVPHPALPVVRGDFFTPTRDQYVLVMNWIDGTDLQQVLDDEGDPGLPVDEVIDSLTQVADALDHLHSHDPPVIHGDVKPANIVRAASGRVFLVDFDISAANSAYGPAGTLGFVAPEVVAGEKPGPAADIFGLGATAVALLNGASGTDLPTHYVGVDPASQGQVARVLRAAMSADPTKRPRSARKLIENLRGSLTAPLPSGLVALLATQVADAGTLWDTEPDEMRVAMSRLRDVQDGVIEARGGRIVASMNEGDHTIAVFREASAAALVALDLHDRIATEQFPPGIDLRLQAAVIVGEATLTGGAYTGVVVDQLLRLRSIAEPGSTITSERTAEQLVEWVGEQMSVVPITSRATTALPAGMAICGITRPGAEATAAVRPLPVLSVAPVVPPGTAESPRAEKLKGTEVAVEALSQTPTLVALTALGLSIIFKVVLSSTLDLDQLGNLAILISAIVFCGCFVWQYSKVRGRRQRQVSIDQQRRDLEQRALRVESERTEARARLQRGFSGIRSTDGTTGLRVVRELGEEFEAMAMALATNGAGPQTTLESLLPDVAQEVYGLGISALSQALDLLHSVDAFSVRMRPEELAAIDGRLEDDDYGDPRERTRDQQRRDTLAKVIFHREQSLLWARDLIFEADRCTAALCEARIELATAGADSSRVDARSVVHTLERTVHIVREMQEEVRRLGTE